MYTSQKEGKTNNWSSTDASSPSDLLSKAMSYTNKCITLCHKNHSKLKSFLEPARVALAYIWMELKNPAPVMRLADLVLAEPLPDHDDRTKSESQGLRAAVRMYACEAMSLMGNPKGGLKYLSREEVDSVVVFLSDARNRARGIGIMGDNNDRDPHADPVDLKASIAMTVESLSQTLQ
jgi:hypothetical protein